MKGQTDKTTEKVTPTPRLAILSAEFNRIEEKYGREVDAELVVAEARDPENALHDRFDWNDATAAHERRLQVARTLLRLTVKVRLNARGLQVEVPERIRIAPDADEESPIGRYVKTEVVLRRPALRREAIQTLARRLNGMRNELSLYEEAHKTGLIGAIDRFYRAVVVTENVPLKEAV